MAATATMEQIPRALMEQCITTSISPLVSIDLNSVRNRQSSYNVPLFIYFPVETSLATSLTILGAWIGSLVCGGPSQQYGKKMTLLMNCSFFIVGAILSATGNIYGLFIGRFISGGAFFR